MRRSMAPTISRTHNISIVCAVEFWNHCVCATLTRRHLTEALHGDFHHTVMVCAQRSQDIDDEAPIVVRTPLCFYLPLA